jgi:hypothetical protein
MSDVAVFGEGNLRRIRLLQPVGAGHELAVPPSHRVEHGVLGEGRCADGGSGMIQPTEEMTSVPGVGGTERDGQQGADHRDGHADATGTWGRHPRSSELWWAIERSGGTLPSSIGTGIGTGQGLIERVEGP